MQTLSPAALAELSSIDPTQPFAPELYNAIARCMLSVAVEAVALRVVGGQTQVFLTRRSPNDAAYPGMLHVPGTVIRAHDVSEDETYQNAMRRLEQDEFGVPIDDFEYLGENFKREPRGPFNPRVFLVRVVGDPTSGLWADVNALPADVIAEHAQFVIPLAVQRFKQRYNLD